MAILRTTLFTLLVPCTVAGWVPYLIARGSNLPLGLPETGATWLGGGLIAIGIVGYLMTAGAFAFVGRGTPSPTHPTDSLATTGLHRYSRNPMYVAVLTVIVGQMVFWNRGLVGIYAVGVWAAFQAFIILYEEKTLRRFYGDAYETYCRNTPRWFV